MQVYNRHDDAPRAVRSRRCRRRPQRRPRERAPAGAGAGLRREHVLGAARAAFFELGLEGASLREIAKRAGYTAGAIYSYFDSKEEVYGALLAESLERLNAHVAAAARRHRPRLRRRPRRAAPRPLAFFDFYRENPRDLDLGFYLFHGMQPRGLTPALERARSTPRLRDALRRAGRPCAALGFGADAGARPR